jgi:hypothetical protein
MEPYEQEKMHSVRSRLEKDLLGWPGVTTKTLFGNPAYVVNGRIFVVLVTDGIVLARLGSIEREEVSSQFRTFSVTGRSGAVIKSWIGVSVLPTDELSPFLPYIRKSYDTAAKNQECLDNRKE